MRNTLVETRTHNPYMVGVMQLLGRRFEGRVAVRELNGNRFPSSRIRHRSCERSDFGKLQAERTRGVSSLLSKIGRLAIFSALAPLFAVSGAVFPSSSGLTLTLAWDPSPDPNVVGYRLYCGGASGQYTNIISAGPSATATITGLTAGATYFFAVTAVNDSGMESRYSNEASNIAPATGTGSRLQLTVSPGKQVLLRITGQPGRTYEIQATENLTQWSGIGVVTLGSGATLDFTDVTTAGRPMRFYRLREVTGSRLQLLLSPSKQAVLRITGLPGHTYEVQATQNLKTWSVLGNVTLGAGAVLDFTDTNAAGHSNRFYRLREIFNP